MNELRKKRLSLGLTMTEMAFLLNRPFNTVSKWDDGRLPFKPDKHGILLDIELRYAHYKKLGILDQVLKGLLYE